MAEKRVGLRMAKPSDADDEAVLRFFQGLESILEYRTHPETEEEIEEDSEVLEWLEQQWRRVGPSWSRVIWAGRTAIGSACDPTLDYLEFKPHILKAVELVQKLADPDPCRYDHHGRCQAHGLHEKPCPHQEAAALIAELPAEDEE